MPSIEQIRHVLSVMPAGSDIERRDRAIIAFTLLSGARHSAIASMCLKHVDVGRRRISQDPRDGVQTKNAKTIITTFFPVGPDVEAIVSDWIGYLQTECLWGPNDPCSRPRRWRWARADTLRTLDWTERPICRGYLCLRTIRPPCGSPYQITSPFFSIGPQPTERSGSGRGMSVPSVSSRGAPTMVNQS